MGRLRPGWASAFSKGAELQAEDILAPSKTPPLSTLQNTCVLVARSHAGWIWPMEAFSLARSGSISCIQFRCLQVEMFPLVGHSPHLFLLSCPLGLQGPGV